MCVNAGIHKANVSGSLSEKGGLSLLDARQPTQRRTAGSQKAVEEQKEGERTRKITSSAAKSEADVSRCLLFSPSTMRNPWRSAFCIFPDFLA